MRKLLLRFTVFVLGLWAAVMVLGQFADRIAPFNIWQQGQHLQYAKLINRKADIQGVSLGNSHSNAIDFDVLGLEGQVLARVSAYLFEAERYIDSIVDDLPALQTVFLPISYFSFHFDNATQDRTRILRIDFYSMLPISQPIQGDFNNFLLGKIHRYSNLMSVVRPDHWHDVITGLPEFNGQDEPITNTDPTGQDCSTLTPDQMDYHGKFVADFNIAAVGEMAAAHPHLVEDASAALGAALERLQSKGIQVILYTPPYSRPYNDQFAANGADVIEAMQEALGRLQARYQVAYYDFSHDPEVLGRPDLMYDSDHLNDCGRKVFTQRLVEAMSATGDSMQRQ